MNLKQYLFLPTIFVATTLITSIVVNGIAPSLLTVTAMTAAVVLAQWLCNATRDWRVAFPEFFFGTCILIAIALNGTYAAQLFADSGSIISAATHMFSILGAILVIVAMLYVVRALNRCG